MSRKEKARGLGKAGAAPAAALTRFRGARARTGTHPSSASASSEGSLEEGATASEQANIALPVAVQHPIFV